MQLISLPASPFAARVRIAVHAKDLPIQIVPPPAGWPRLARFRDVSPTGRIPVLLDDADAIWESAVILEFLEERFPEARPLLPSAPHERTRARALVAHVDQMLMPPMVALARPGNDQITMRRAVEALLEGIAILDRLLPDGPYAVSRRLSVADCALAPALFAARVTEQRLGFELLASAPAVASYAELAAQDPHVSQDLGEMETGLRHLVKGG